MEFNEYEKIVILSTLAEPRTLHDISKAWYGHKTRLYHKTVRQKLDEAVKRGTLIKEDKLIYRANTKFIVETLIQEIGTKGLAVEYRNWLKQVYLNLGAFSQKAYLSFDVIKSLTQSPTSKGRALDVHKGLDLDLKLLLQLPFILRYLEQQHSSMANLLIQLFGFEAYAKTIGRLELQHAHILQEARRLDDWSRSMDKLATLLPKLQKKGVSILGLQSMMGGSP